jgi:toxin CcdB
MARFDVYEVKGTPFPYVVDVQSDLLYDIETRVVIPLIPAKSYGRPPFPRLTPVLKIGRTSYLLMTPNIGAQDSRLFKKPVSNLAKYSFEITDSIDFLLQGF